MLWTQVKQLLYGPARRQRLGAAADASPAAMEQEQESALLNELAEGDFSADQNIVEVYTYVGLLGGKTIPWKCLMCRCSWCWNIVEIFEAEVYSCHDIVEVGMMEAYFLPLEMFLYVAALDVGRSSRIIFIF